MKHTPLRVLLDTNVFSQSHFPTIDSSPMRELCRRGRIIAIYPSLVIDETLKTYLGNATNRRELITRWLPFMSDTAQRRFCVPLRLIIHRELVCGHGKRTNVFATPCEQQEWLGKMLSMELDGSSPHMIVARPIWTASTKRLARRRDLMKTFRAESSRPTGALVLIAEDFKLLRSKHDRAQVLELHALEQIKRHVLPNGDWRALYDRWARDKGSYLHFTQLIENAVYQYSLAISDHTAQLDQNAQPDLDIMTHLLHADVLVSDDQKFMRRAFSDLWRPRGKVLMTPGQFVEHLTRF